MATDVNHSLPRFGVLLVVSGPSGAGKSSICARVRKEMPELRFSVSCTTRQPRKGEQHGKEYYFITRNEFEQKIAQNEFVEYAEVFGNFYGTLKSEVIKWIEQGDDVFLDIDIQGAIQIKQAAAQNELLRKCAQSIFIVPPNLQELERRLRGRNSDSEEQIQQRLAKAGYEIGFWREYDFVLVNDNLETAAAEMKSLIAMTRKATLRIKEGWFHE
jgi:guanylate kinase